MGESLIKMTKIMILSFNSYPQVKSSSFRDELLIKSLFGAFKPKFLCNFSFLGFLS